MAKKIEDMSDRQLRTTIHHAKNADEARAAMAQLEKITPEKNRAGLRGIRTAASRKIRDLEAVSDTPSSGKSGGSSGRGQPSGGNKPSGKERWPESRLRRAMRNDGDPEAHAILRGRGRVNRSDERAYQRAVAEKQAAANDATIQKLSRRETRELTRNAERGDKRSLERLRETGNLTSQVEQQYNRARGGADRRWADRVISSSRGSWEEQLIADVVRHAPESKRDHMAERAKVTIDDLKEKGHDERVIRGVVDQYADEAALRQAHREADKLRAKLEAEKEKREGGRGR